MPSLFHEHVAHKSYAFLEHVIEATGSNLKLPKDWIHEHQLENLSAN